MARHRLQRLSSPSPTLSLLLHLVGVASFAYSFHFLTAWDTPISRAFGWHFQFLTVIGLSGSLLAFVLGTLADVTSSAALFAAKNAVSIVVTPLEALISVLYWAIFSYDASLLMPPDVKLSVPVDLNFHLVPAVLLTLDLLFFSPPNVVSTNGMAAIGAAMATLYWHWVELCHEKNGWYALPNRPPFLLGTSPARGVELNGT